MAHPFLTLKFDRFYIIQLAMKAVQFTHITLQRTVNNKHSRVYKQLKYNWQFFLLQTSQR